MHQIINFAKGELGIKLHPGQARELSAYYESGLPDWLNLSGRRSGKSLLADVIACYEALVPDFSAYIRPEEPRHIIIVANRLDNARLHIDNISKMLSRRFKSKITNVTQDRIELSNGAVILCLPASARAGRGYTASCVIFDELAHFVDSDGNQSADAVYNAFSPTVATFGDAARIVITTTPFTRTGIVFGLFDRINSGELADQIYLTHCTTQEMNPKVGEGTIKRALKRDEESARTEYFAEFRDPLEAFLNPLAIDRAVDEHLTELHHAEPGKQYIMAIDPAIMRDNFAFAVMHTEKGVHIVDMVRALKAPVDPNEAEDLLFLLNKNFHPSRILCDNPSLVQRLRGKLPNLEYKPFTRPMKLEIYGSLKEAINLENFQMYKQQDAIDELKALQIRNGVDIAAPKSGRITHDDLCDVLALCVNGLVKRAGVGEVEYAPNFIYGTVAGQETYEDWLWRKQHTAEHPPGVTWENCKNRHRGCDACERETAHMVDPETGIWIGDNQPLEVPEGAHVSVIDGDLLTSLITRNIEREYNKEIRDQKILDLFYKGANLHRKGY